jgi:xanthine dehydrogenase iron-sulfur cluster and FAD-binding subunit A
MAAHALLERNPNPTEEEIRHDLSSNLCMCTGYVQIVEAIKSLAAGGLHPSTNARGALSGVEGQASGSAKK